MSKRSKRAGDSFSPPAHARARVWEGENLERVHRGRNHEEMLLPLLRVCLRDLRGLLFLTLLVVKHAQVWGSSSFHFRSLFSHSHFFYVDNFHVFLTRGFVNSRSCTFIRWGFFCFVVGFFLLFFAPRENICNEVVNNRQSIIHLVWVFFSGR